MAAEIQKRRQEGGDEVERVKKIFGLDDKNRIREDKVSPKCTQYNNPCRQGLNGWATVLDEFQKHVQPGTVTGRGN